MDNKIELCLLDESTIHQQVGLSKIAFGKSSDESILLDRWKKKHFENPLGNSIIVGAYIGDELVGMNAYSPSLYTYQGETVRALQSCESAVHPNFQGMGIWSKVVKYAINYVFTETDYAFIFGFPNYRNSYPGFTKMQWQTVDNMRNYLMINNGRSFSKAISHNPIVRFLSIFGAAQKFGILLHSCSKQSYQIVNCDIDELIWTQPNEAVKLHPDIDWIRWKIGYKNCKIGAVRKDGNMVATFIYEVNEYKGEEAVNVEIIQTMPSYMTKKVLSLIFAFICKECPRTAYLRIWSMDGDILQKQLKRLLFLKSSHPNPFIIKEQTKKYGSMKWDLSFFDLD